LFALLVALPVKAESVETGTTATEVTATPKPVVTTDSKVTVKSLKKHTVGKKAKKAIAWLKARGFEVDKGKPVNTASKVKPGKVAEIRYHGSLLEDGHLRYRAKVTIRVYKFKDPGQFWTKKDVREVLSDSCDKHGVKGKKKQWVINKYIRIIFGKSPTSSAESRSGNEKAGHRNGCFGLLQFATNWIGKTDKRGDGYWALDRGVRVFVDGGPEAMQNAWKATYW
jgi:hypothetical protein